MNTGQKRNWYTQIRKEENLFVIKIVAVFAAWEILPYFLVHVSVVRAFWQNFIFRFGSLLSGISSFILNLFGEDTFQQGISVVYRHSGRYIMAEDHCLAIPAMVLFIFSILFFSGKWSNKLWFIPLGIFAILIINTIRFILLCYIFEHFSSNFYYINHAYIYVVATYSLILLLLIWWMHKFSDNSK